MRQRVLKAYRLATDAVAPLLPLWLALRQWRGKEDGLRLRERYGHASVPRPEGPLLWLHAASVGEANSVLLLIEKIRAGFPRWHILLTTGTLTSARLMATRLPKGVIHQFVPLDVHEYTQRFMRHWQPDMAMLVESELWPNLIISADEAQCFLGIINARMSERSFASWKKRPAMIGDVLSRFDFVFAQSEADGARIRELGAKNVSCAGNLKYDATLLPCDEGELLALKTAIATRPLWLAASTHPGEEEMIARVHALLSVRRPDLLTVIVPRHPQRGEQIAAALPKSALRSRRDAVHAGTAFYIADTLGELGLFYRLSEVVFMGGSLVKHGGQNPLEAARLSCAIATGPYTHNFSDIYTELEQHRACRRVANANALAAEIDALLNQSALRDTLGKNALTFVEGKGGCADRLLAALAPALGKAA